MKPSRIRTLLIGLTAGVAYAVLVMLFVMSVRKSVSVGYIFVLPIIFGAIPVLFSTKEQLKAYKTYLLLPWGIAITFSLLSLISGFEGMICLVIIIGPFLILGSVGGFIFRLIKLKDRDDNTPLYSCLILPFLVILLESNIEVTDQFYTVNTELEVNAPRSVVWDNIKNVKNIKDDEIETHFIHLIGIPKPLDGRIDREEAGGIRSISWAKGIKFQEHIKTWKKEEGFSYDIIVDPNSIPPTTLDEHVMIGGEYFDVVNGSYKIEPVSKDRNKVILTCTYRVTTNLNLYSRWWADYILNDFNEMILEVIKKRCEKVR